MSRKHTKKYNEQTSEKDVKKSVEDDPVKFTEERADDGEKNTGKDKDVNDASEQLNKNNSKDNEMPDEDDKAVEDIETNEYYDKAPTKASISDERESREDARRSARRYRRRAEQRNAALITTVLLAVVTVLILFGVKKLSNIIAGHQAAEEYAKQSESASAAEASSIVIAEPSTETEMAETESVDYLQNVVDSCIQEMPIEDKVAQLFIVTPEQLTGAETVQQAGDATQDALSEKAVGGILYFKQNLKDKEQVSEMLKNTSAMSKYPLFLAIDEEGGKVSRVADAGIEGSVKVDSEAAIAAEGDSAKAGEAGETIGSYLSALGFNLDFAPVADVVTDQASSSIGDRSYGADPTVDGQMVAAMTTGLQQTGVSACLKHFPGIGDASGDTHEQKVEIAETLDDMKQKNFIPFKAGIDAGADFVMVGHADVSKIDTSAEYVPASLSKMMITDELRGELGFNGIVVTDAMNMKAISDYFGADEAAVKAIQAGVDIILTPADYDKAYSGVLAAVKDGTISEDRINESLERIYSVKYEDKINGVTSEDASTSAETATASSESSPASSESAKENGE